MRSQKLWTIALCLSLLIGLTSFQVAAHACQSVSKQSRHDCCPGTEKKAALACHKSTNTACDHCQLSPVAPGSDSSAVTPAPVPLPQVQEEAAPQSLDLETLQLPLRSKALAAWLKVHNPYPDLALKQFHNLITHLYFEFV